MISTDLHPTFATWARYWRKYNLIEKESELARQLAEELKEWHIETLAKIPKKYNAEFDSLYAYKNYKVLQY